MIIPIYIAFHADDYTHLNSAAASERHTAIKDSIENKSRPITDIDVAFEDTIEALAETLDPSTASGIVFGTADWDGEDLTDGMRITTPEQVTEYAAALESLDPDEFDDPDPIDTLTDFYTAARDRGDAVAVYFN
ncbi:DUF1877 family protein [Corynebacterium sp. CCUG 71335]|uniref:DUF1877 family protein n=1 Tax=Corynebacterium sp. CCUG 71335 TaxID=2823892 RepID=UPI0021099D98|nr:DUF1877 family protein [Corynebacterium sp. CCUG 71335]MCQ4621503.1 DUF1877 family protein [Corynebacterium sp. CCUG 71335]